MKKVKDKIFLAIKNNPVTTIAIILAIITCIFIPVDREYINYFDIKTLCCLSCILAVVQCLKNSGFFQELTKKIVFIFNNTRSVVLALVLLTFACDLFLANDMSLITLLPLTFIVLQRTGNLKYYSLTLILQNIAANMSGMITPHGNPQNLYLYSHYNIATAEFIKILLPQFFIVLLLLIVIPLITVKKEPLKLAKEKNNIINKKNMPIYMALFIFSLLIIFRIVPYHIGTIIVLISVFLLDKEALKKADWDLILTFCAFFVFSGNLSRIPLVHEVLANLINKNVLITGILSCQFISNVPTAILLSNFTSNYKDLLISVNIGSLGTLISSLASLITLKQFIKNYPGHTKEYIIKFTILNTIFLLILITFTLF